MVTTPLETNGSSVISTEGRPQSDKPIAAKERRALGKARRRHVPRSALAQIAPEDGREDPLELIKKSTKDCLTDLLPIRFGRMAVSPFTFYRGTAMIMAADLAKTPTSGFEGQICGDAHLMNFGGFATPERNLIFDLNDFDETHPGPWEWDIKRLATSMLLAGRDREFTASQNENSVLSCARSYREHMDTLATMRTLDVWYSRLDAEAALAEVKDPALRKRYEIAIEKAESHTLDHIFPKLTTTVGTQRRFLEDKPYIYHAEPQARVVRDPQTMLASYRESLSEDRRHLYDHYHFADIAIKVVGVGSVGTRCLVALFFADDDDPLILQIKEARHSVLEHYTERSKFDHSGKRVVIGQRLLQAASDLFLGWGQDGDGHHYYVRQLRDMKASANLESMPASALEKYGSFCAWALARAHAKAGDPAPIAGYIGKGDNFDQAILTFAKEYADRAEADYAKFAAAVKSGDIEAVVPPPPATQRA